MMTAPSGAAAPVLRPEDVVRAVADANVPTLIATLVQLTGSREWLADRYRPERVRGLTEPDGGGLPADAQAEVRAAADVAIREWLEGKPVAIPRFEPDEALEILGFTMGEDVPPDYADYLMVELDAVEAPERNASISKGQELSGLSVAIVGAGVSGIAAAIAMTRHGAEVVLFERTEDLGGTWNLNRYPGCGVDTASHLYSLSYEPADWAYYYAPQRHLKEYVKQVAARHGVTDRVRLGTEVTAAQFDSTRSAWRLELEDRTGARSEHWADVLISAVGAFGKPSIPPIEGLDDFCGSVYHTADWPADADLSDRRVAVVGTGASAMQFVPAIVDTVRSLTVYQRSPQWAAPFEEFHKPIDLAVRSLLRSVPYYQAWYRARLGWNLNDKIHESLQIDPSWDDGGRSINPINAGHRRFFTRYMERELDGDPALLEKTLPAYPPFGKRMLLDNGWFRTLRREHVELVVDPILRVERQGIRTRSGRLIETDVLVLATGFDVVHFLSSVCVQGVDGQVLGEVWDGDNGRAYLGLTVPGFPNMFCLYGPNAAPGHGGSYFNNAEAQLNYLVDLLGKMRAAGAASVDVKPSVYDEYNARVDDAHSKMIWSHPGFKTYYRNPRGRVVYANPWRIVDFWGMTRSARLDEYTTRHLP
jgi:4-hydroxyacetophenone monooxygenase